MIFALDGRGGGKEGGGEIGNKDGNKGEEGVAESEADDTGEKPVAVTDPFTLGGEIKDKVEATEKGGREEGGESGRERGAWE